MACAQLPCRVFVAEFTGFEIVFAHFAEFVGAMVGGG